MIDTTPPNSDTAAAIPVTAPESPALATGPSHPADAILAEIEIVLHDLETIPAHIATWLKAKLAEARARF